VPTASPGGAAGRRAGILQFSGRDRAKAAVIDAGADRLGHRLARDLVERARVVTLLAAALAGSENIDLVQAELFTRARPVPPGHVAAGRPRCLD
jgi:hypothetical protein